jgi:hypothetical protein
MGSLADLRNEEMSMVAEAMAWADACRANGNLDEAARWDAEVERLIAAED